MTIGSTGPKISSFMIRISCVTPVSTTGAMKLPSIPSTSVGPPVSFVAPLSTASSTSSVTIFACSSEIMGPISVVHWRGSPTVSRSVSRTTPSTKASDDVAVDVDALDPRAGLAGVREAAPDRTGDRVGEIRVGADDLRVLAAELEHRALHPLGALDPDLPADLDGAGEEDLSGAGLDQRVADPAASVHRADEALGQTGLLEGLADALADQRSQAGRLENHAVPRHQGDGDLAEGDRPGVVPGCDHAHDADRLVGELGALRLEEDRHRELLVGEDLRAVVGDPLQGVDRGEQLHRVALDPRLALLAGEQLGDLVKVLEQHVAGAPHVASAILERERRPEGLHLGDVVDDPLHLGRGQGLDAADQLPGRRVEGLERRLGALLRARLLLGLGGCGAVAAPAVGRRLPPGPRLAGARLHRLLPLVACARSRAILRGAQRPPAEAAVTLTPCSLVRRKMWRPRAIPELPASVSTPRLFTRRLRRTATNARASDVP